MDLFRNAHKWNKKGLDFYKSGKFEKALMCFDKALKINSRYEDAWRCKGITLDKMGKYYEAIICFAKIVEIKFGYVPMLRLDSQRKNEALTCYNYSVEKKSNNEWNLKAIDFDKCGKYKEAIDSYDKALELNSNDVLALNNKGVDQHILGKFREAFTCFDKVVQLDPNSALGYNNKGVVLFSLLSRLRLLKSLSTDETSQLKSIISHGYELSIEFFNKAIEKDSNVERPWFNKGLSLETLERYEAGIEELTVEMWALVKPFRYKEAIKCFNKAIELDPLHVEAFNNKAIVLGRIGEYEEAIIWYDEALHIDPNNPDIWSDKGTAFRRLGETLHNRSFLIQANESYDRAIAINSRHEYSWYNKGNVLDVLGHHGEAIKCFDKVIQINPNNEQAWNNSGTALYGLEKYVEAIDNYDKAININPNFKLASNNKQLVLKKLKNVDRFA